MKTKTTKPAKTKYSPTYWNGEGEAQEIYDALNEVLVPDHGAAATEPGEALRWIGNIYHEVYNNGGCNAVEYCEGERDLRDEYWVAINTIARVANLTGQECTTLNNALKYGGAMCDGNRPRSAKRLDDIVTKVTRAVLMATLRSIVLSTK